MSWLRIALGVLLLLAALRSWRKRPAPGVEPKMPEWMAGIDTLAPGKALGLGAVLVAANPKNLVLVVGAAAGLAELGVSTGDAVVALMAFVVVGSLSVAGPVVYYLAGGERAKASLEDVKVWLTVNNAAVMTVLFLVFGGVLIANGRSPITD